MLLPLATLDRMCAVLICRGTRAGRICSIYIVCCAEAALPHLVLARP